MAAVGREDTAAVEGIQENAVPAHAEPGDEVAGKPDPVEIEPDPPAHLDQDERERDWDAEPPVQDLVQETVPGIEVVPPVAGKANLGEEEFAEPMKNGHRVGSPPHTVRIHGAARGQLVQTA